MTPAHSPGSPCHRALIDSQNAGQHPVGYLGSSDGSHLSFGKNGFMMSLPAGTIEMPTRFPRSLPSLSNCILSVLTVCSYPKMIWPDARRVITGMHDNTPAWYLVTEKFECISMGTDLLPVLLGKHPVSILVPGRRPLPTSGTLPRLRPEPLLLVHLFMPHSRAAGGAFKSPYAASDAAMTQSSCMFSGALYRMFPCLVIS